MARATLKPKETRLRMQLRPHAEDRSAPAPASQGTTSAVPAPEAPKVRRPLVRPREGTISGTETGRFTELQQVPREPEEEGRSRPYVTITVQAQDGRWVFGPESKERELRAKKKGDYSCAADATQAASKVADILINTASASIAPPRRKLLVRR